MAGRARAVPRRPRRRRRDASTSTWRPGRSPPPPAPAPPPRPSAARRRALPAARRARVAGVRLPQPHRALRRRRSRSSSWPSWRPRVASTCWRSPITTRSATIPTSPAAGAHAGVLLLPGPGGHHRPGPRQLLRRDRAGSTSASRPDSWRATADARGGLMSVNHPWAGDCAWRHAAVGPGDVRRDVALHVGPPGGRAARRLERLRHGADRRQRLPPSRGPRHARRADHLGGGRGAHRRRRAWRRWSTAGWRSAPTRRHRSCSVTTASSLPSTPTAPRSSTTTAGRASWSTERSSRSRVSASDLVTLRLIRRSGHCGSRYRERG